MDNLTMDHAYVPILTFNHENTSNSFSLFPKPPLVTGKEQVKRDDSACAVAFTGGENRLLSAGSGFREVQYLTGGDEADDRIDTFTTIFLSALTFPKPMIGPLDGRCFGMGLRSG